MKTKWKIRQSVGDNYTIEVDVKDEKGYKLHTLIIADVSGEANVKLMAEAPETKAKLKRAEAQRDELLSDLNSALDTIIFKLGEDRADVRHYRDTIKSITKSND